MYCSKCGTRVADDDYACYMCGSRLHNNVRSALEILREQEALEALKTEDEDIQVVFSDDPIEATVRQMLLEAPALNADEASDTVYPAVDEVTDGSDLVYIHSLIGDRDERPVRKGQSATFIALIVIVTAAIAVFVTYLVLTRSGAEIDEAVQTQDIVKVSELYDELPDEEKKEEVRVSMIGRVRELRDGYLAEEISYDEVMAQLDLLKDSVFDDSAEFDEINEQIERINTSRLAFEKAERAFGRGDYPDAVNGYKEVLSEDEEYYKKAQEGIVRCNDAVLQTVMGRWRYEYDARKEVQQYVKEKGFDLDLSKMKIPINFLFDLKDDGSIDVSVDYDALNEYIDKVLDLAVETMSKGVEAGLPGNADISSILKNVYNSTGMKENIKQQLNIGEALDNLLKEAGVDKIDSYRAEDGHLYIGTACMDVELAQETLILTSEDSEALAVGHYKMTYPIKMQLVKRWDKPDTGDVTIEVKPE